MSPATFPLVLNRAPSFKTREPAEAQAYLSKVFRPHSLNSGGRLGRVAFRHTVADLGPNLSLHQLSYGSEIFNQGGPSDDSYLAVFTLAGTLRMHASGREVISRSGTLCVMNPRQPFSTHLSADPQQLTLRIAGTLMRGSLMQTLGAPLTQPLEFDAVSCLIRQQATGLTRMVGALCDELRHDGSAFLKPPITGHLERALAGLLLAEVPNSYTGHVSQETAEAAPNYVRTARKFIRANAHRKVSVVEIARAVNVTPRTLQYARRLHLDMTPGECLRNARLDLAAYQLSLETDRRLKVSDVASNCGFASASKFARYYRERFGHIPPAATVRTGRYAGRRTYNLSTG